MSIKINASNHIIWIIQNLNIQQDTSNGKKGIIIIKCICVKKNNEKLISWFEKLRKAYIDATKNGETLNRNNREMEKENREREFWRKNGEPSIREILMLHGCRNPTESPKPEFFLCFSKTPFLDSLLASFPSHFSVFYI
jgi:hypothetical protein